jgi:hypothetical protein
MTISVVSAGIDAYTSLKRRSHKCITTQFENDVLGVCLFILLICDVFHYAECRSHFVAWNGRIINE